jgi:O-succinylbenzoic acid--CoA ligase
MPRFILNGRQITLTQINEESAADFNPYELRTLRFCQQWLAGQDSFVLQTSGSTGKPKTIILRRAPMYASARLTGKALGLKAGDRALVCLSTEYIAGVMMLVRGFELNLSLTVITPTRNPLATLPENVSFDFAAFTPLQLQEILTSTPEKKAILDKMRAILVGGAPISDGLLHQIKTLDAPIYHTYGMTETVSHIALKRLNGQQASDYFVPLEGVKLGLTPQGCLTVASVLTNQQTLATNDLVDLQADGSFRWLGRIDNVINSGGVKVQAEVVESALQKLFREYQGGILSNRQSCVGPMEHPQLGQVVVAMVEGQPIEQEILADIRLQLWRSRLLKKYEVPRYFFFISRFLETATGKIDRPANLAGLRLP